MRLATAAAVAAACACSVPDKDPIAPDAGRPDAGVDAGPDDRVPPETMITAAPAEFSPDGTATFEFTSDDPVASFECGIDEGDTVACTSPFSRALEDGPHSFRVRAIDAAGNGDDSPAEHLWSIDRDPPNTTITERPPAADNSTNVTFEFTSNEDNVVFQCSLDQAAYSLCESGIELGPLGDGSHVFAVRARDRAGNLDNSPALHAWTIDTGTPDTTLLSGPEGATSMTSATFTFVSPDAGAGATFQCSIDGGGFTACTSPRTYNGLNNGEHIFAVRVRDAVGNVDPTPADRRWTVDSTPPNTGITAGPSGVVAAASASFSFISNEMNVTFACSLDGGAFAPCTSPENLTGLGQGSHTFAVRATDLAGQPDPTPATRSWTVDTLTPDIVFTSGPGNGSTTGPRVIFEFTVNEGAVQCSLDGSAFVPCSSPRAMSLPAGDHAFSVRATDAAGNTTTASRMWTVACTAPDPAGAAGLLHLDDAGQTMTNAVAGGADGVLGDDTTIEVDDPSQVAGRFAGGLDFFPPERDHVSWPVALAPSAELTMEIWIRPGSQLNTRIVAATGDDRFQVRSATVNASTARISVIVVQTDGTPRVVTSQAVPPNAWHHVIASLQGNVLRIWVDGNLTMLAGIDLGGPFALDAIRLGGAGATSYGGGLDEVWVGLSGVADNEAALARYCPL